MSFANNKILKTTSIAIFLAGIVTVVAAFVVSGSRQPSPPAAFTISSTQMFIPAGEDKPYLNATIVRYQKADGSFKSTATYYNADGTIQKVANQFGETGDGVFNVNEKNKELDFVGPRSANKFDVTLETLQRDPSFIRRDSILGYQTAVLHFAEGDAAYTDVYRAPALQGLPIKLVMADKHGMTIIEATKIEIGEPDPSAFDSIDKYPVSYDSFNRKIERLESEGNSPLAEQLRQQLRQRQNSK